MEVKRYYPASLWPNSPLDCHSSSYARALLRTWPRGGLARLAFPAKSKRQIYAPDDGRSVKCAKIARLLLPQTGGLHHTVTTRMNSTELSKRLELPHHRRACLVRVALQLPGRHSNRRTKKTTFFHRRRARFPRFLPLQF